MTIVRHIHSVEVHRQQSRRTEYHLILYHIWLVWELLSFVTIWCSLKIPIEFRIQCFSNGLLSLGHRLVNCSGWFLSIMLVANHLCQFAFHLRRTRCHWQSVKSTMTSGTLRWVSENIFESYCWGIESNIVEFDLNKQTNKYINVEKCRYNERCQSKRTTRRTPLSSPMEWADRFRESIDDLSIAQVLVDINDYFYHFGNRWDEFSYLIEFASFWFQME